MNSGTSSNISSTSSRRRSSSMRRVSTPAKKRQLHHQRRISITDALDSLDAFHIFRMPKGHGGSRRGCGERERGSYIEGATSRENETPIPPDYGRFCSQLRDALNGPSLRAPAVALSSRRQSSVQVQGSSGTLGLHARSPRRS